MAKKTSSKNVLDKDRLDWQDAAEDQKSQAPTCNLKEPSPGYGFFDDMQDEGRISTTQKDESGDVIRLGTALTIQSVASCKARIDKAISHGLDVKISAAELQKIDTAGLQLLYSLQKTLHQSSQVIHWQSTNPVINRAAKMIGMQDLYEDSQQDTGYGFF